MQGGLRFNSGEREMWGMPGLLCLGCASELPAKVREDGRKGSRVPFVPRLPE